MTSFINQSQWVKNSF